MNFPLECSGKRARPGLGKPAAKGGVPAVLVDGSPRSFWLKASMTQAGLGCRPRAGTDRRWSNVFERSDILSSQIIPGDFSKLFLWTANEQRKKIMQELG